MESDFNRYTEEIFDNSSLSLCHEHLNLDDLTPLRVSPLSRGHDLHGNITPKFGHVHTDFPHCRSDLDRFDALFRVVSGMVRSVEASGDKDDAATVASFLTTVRALLYEHKRHLYLQVRSS